MPKKKQNLSESPGVEGRPPNPTLACFLKNAKPMRKPAKTSSDVKEKKLDKAEGEQNDGLGLGKRADERVAVDETHNECSFARSTSVDLPENDISTTRNVEMPAGFKIMRTKKGGLPIYVEKRAKGKKVTVIRQITGDSKSLLQLLKTKFGTGGLIKPGEVEIQGDFEDKLLKYLQENRSFMVPYSN